MNSATLLLLTVFIFLLGLCVGSFLNVVIWRLPHSGMSYTFGGKVGKLSLSWPSSHCPKCQSLIPMYWNVPVLGWLWLRGKCGKCGSGISIRYPLVELGTGILFAGLYVSYVVGGWAGNQMVMVDGSYCWGSGIWLGLPQDFGWGEMFRDWPVVGLHCFMIASLLAAAGIDADWFIIPLEIPKILAVITLLLVGWVPSELLPTVDSRGPWAWPIIGGMVGLGLAYLLLKIKVILQSFPVVKKEEVTAPEVVATIEVSAEPGVGNIAVEQAPEGEVVVPVEPLVATEKPVEVKPEDEKLPPPPGGGNQRMVWGLVVAFVLVGVLGAWWWLTLTGKTERWGGIHYVTLGTMVTGIVLFLMGVLPRDPESEDVAEDVLDEISGPNVRVEVLKEVLYLAFPVAGMVLGYLLSHGQGLPDFGGVGIAGWNGGLGRVLGSMLGLLVGGGVVWGTRVLGTLGFGKEAMGLGDVHLMYGVGAVVGAPIVIVIFLVLAPVLGLGWAVLQKCIRRTQILPYGPWLVVGTILSLLVGNSFVEWYLKMLRG